MNIIQICIGDWSSDGHSQKEMFSFEVNVSTKELREAYFLSVEKEGWRLDGPDAPWSDYQEMTLVDEDHPVVTLAKEIDIDAMEMWHIELAKVVAHFITKHNPHIEMNMIPMNTLHFWGFDDKKRHISNFGYGLFQ